MYHESQSGGTAGTPIYQTTLLSDDFVTSLQKYIPDVAAAVFNNYQCIFQLNGVAPTGTSTGFDPTNTDIPPCFYNFGPTQFEEYNI